MPSILITGNMGYIGPCVAAYFRSEMPGVRLFGLDRGFFATNLPDSRVLPECMLEAQHFIDVRDVTPELFRGIDAVVHLAAISNDPMGNAYERVTEEINHRGTMTVAKAARDAGVHHFAFASSCSVYGFAGDGARTEESEVNPLTAYARSKVAAERDLAGFASSDFVVTCMRFATACGASPRLRLDLVLNDFVASATATNAISILSDGAPWRPLIAVDDMARAIGWAVARPASNGGEYLVVNAGSNNWNYRIRDLAGAVAEAMPGTQVSINPKAAPDRRSYKVDFSRFATLAPHHQPSVTLPGAVEGLRSLLQSAGFNDANFRESRYMRLNMLSQLTAAGLLDSDLRRTQAAQ